MLTTKSDRLCASTTDSPPQLFTALSTSFDSFGPITESDPTTS